MAFIIKEGDLLPNLPFQILDAAGAPRDLSDVDEINIVVRKKGTVVVLFKKVCTITSIPTGVGLYDWAVGDTDTAGTMEYEFEITFTNGDIQTVPVDRNLELTVQPDIG